MSGKRRLLDLFCGPGFAARGYALAGFEVVGVDIEPQPLYPFEFVQDDALEYLKAIALIVSGFDAIHASPPCFRYSSITAVSGTPEDHPDLVGPIRKLLEATGLPWVIENVPRSPLRSPSIICGTSMGCRTIDDRYRLKRHRHFETSFPMLTPACSCNGDPREVLGVYGGGTSQATRIRRNPRGGNTNKANTRQARELYGITEALPRTAMNLGFPPAYTELIGHQLMQHLDRQAREPEAPSKNRETVS